MENLVSLKSKVLVLERLLFLVFCSLLIFLYRLALDTLTQDLQRLSLPVFFPLFLSNNSSCFSLLHEEHFSSCGVLSQNLTPFTSLGGELFSNDLKEELLSDI